MKKILVFSILCLTIASCSPASYTNDPKQDNSNLTSTKSTSQPVTSKAQAAEPATQLATPLPVIVTPQASALVGTSGLPNFDHIVLITLENRGYASVIGNPQMPQVNALATQNVLLSNYHAVAHPSLPNYIALMSGSTQHITSDCTKCFVNAPNLADLIEASGRTWKSYLEDLPSPCFVGDAGNYAQKHDPLIYFDSIRLNATRCEHSIVPLTNLDGDLTNNQLPNFSFIMPNLCNSGHDCSVDVADKWVGGMVAKLQASPALGNNSLIVIAFDEASDQDKSGCCGMSDPAGGRVAVVMISPTALPDMTDDTPYSHYSLLKTILTAWNLPALGQTAQDTTQAIVVPWTGQHSQSVAPNPTAPAVTQLSTATKSATPTQMSVASSGSGMLFPIRAAFYYPWFPESWNQSGMNPFTHYQPTLGFYNEDDGAIIQQQIMAMQYGKIQLGIASWWGKGHYTDKRFPVLLQDGQKAGFKWSAYMESEGIADPGIDAIRSDLQYIHDNYASSPAYLKIGGHFVVFVYGDANDGCSMVDRWTQANSVGAYLVLKIFTGYRKCTSQPDAWHQYSPAGSQKSAGKFSFTISPGFWKASETQPRLERNLQQWNEDIRAMIASNANFQLITSFNEWGEGTAVESASAWKSSSGFGSYLDSLHNDGNPAH